MALDEPHDDDEHHQVDGLPFVMAAGMGRLIGQYRDVKVDHFPGHGFYAATTLSAGCNSWF